MATAKKASKKSNKDTLLDRVVLLGSSLAYLTKTGSDELIDALEKNKVISTKDGKQAVEKAKSELKSRQAHVQKTVVAELGKVIDQLGLATKKDLEEIKKKSTKKPARKAATKAAKPAKKTAKKK